MDELNLLDIIDPKIVKKLDNKIKTEIVENSIDSSLEEIDNNDFNDIIESESAEIYISKVPKSDVPIFYDAIKKIKKMGVRSEWKCLKILINAALSLTDEQLKNIIK